MQWRARQLFALAYNLGNFLRRLALPGKGSGMLGRKGCAACHSEEPFDVAQGKLRDEESTRKCGIRRNSRPDPSSLWSSG